MPQPHFDVLAYTRDLEAVGFNRPQAEALARGMTNMVMQQIATLVSREHFDLRSSKVDQRFDWVDQRFEQVDQRFEQVDRRFEQIERHLAQIDTRLDKMDQRLTRLEGMRVQVSVHTFMLGLITLVNVVPQLQQWFSV